MATLANVLSDLRAAHLELDISVNPELIARPGIANPVLYHFHYLEYGLSENSGEPVARETKKAIYVWNEGEIDEQAFYDTTEDENQVAKKTIAVDKWDVTLSERAAVYNSRKFRGRVLGALLVAAQAWYSEIDNATIKLVGLIRKTPEPYVLYTVAHLAASNANSFDNTLTDTEIQNLVNGLKDKWLAELA